MDFVELVSIACLDASSRWQTSKSEAYVECHYSRNIECAECDVEAADLGHRPYSRLRNDWIAEQGFYKRIDRQKHKGHHNQTASKPDADNDCNCGNPGDNKSVVQLDRLGSSKDDGKRVSLRDDVFLDIAGVVRKHDESNSNDCRDGPEDHAGIKDAT